MRYTNLVMLVSAVVSSAAPPPQWDSDGRALFLAGEFKRASHAFERAVAERPDRADLHYWLGKSYARLTAVSNPLSAAKYARRARRSLEQAVRTDPRNDKYLVELFDFYADSPQWSGGGPERAAAVLERISPEAPGVELRRMQLAASRKEFGGPAWWVWRPVVWMSGAAGYLVPRP